MIKEFTMRNLLSLSFGRVLSGHDTLHTAMGAAVGALRHPPGVLGSPEPAWSVEARLDREPFLWALVAPSGTGAAVLSPAAAGGQAEYELRVCEGSSGIRHGPACRRWSVRLVGGELSVITGQAGTLEHAGIWVRVRSGAPLADRLALDARDLLARAGETLRPVRALSDGALADPRTREERLTAVEEEVVSLMAAHPADPAGVAPAVLRGTASGDAPSRLHLSVQAWASGVVSVCGLWLDENLAAAVGPLPEPCKFCFGLAPLDPVPVFTGPEHDAWTAYLARRGGKR
ncbi:hypothetical protein OG689_44600 [Kitasatospora sp. NBC_00240]|uniref:hypothetical protein n=1 Tax=Kitasatospora sp. NBC_00240 TaxID=2903567 RepID=UPI002252E0D7|nr:hypothetical protein [Kitasatospora sp. NBC_00240]MCX5216220.1 hypothetical protein [Kitasatospora sp. NBC_00240]